MAYKKRMLARFRFLSGIKLKTYFVFTAALVAGITLAGADELARKGREIFQQHQKAVVTVQIVVKSRISMGGAGGQTNETRQNITGTVVDPSGLTVLSLATLDPGQTVQRLMPGDNRIKVESELSAVKILLDGEEVPAEVVLRDRELDLGFIRPRKAAKFEAVDLASSAKAEVLEEVITLNRLGSAAGRAYAASVERISALVEQPRLFYVPDKSMTSTSLGSPCFTLDGKVLGIFVMRAVQGRTAGSSLFASQAENVTTIILPAEAVLGAAKQAPLKAPAEEPARPAAPANDAAGKPAQQAR